MKDASKKILSALQNKGYRITNARTAVVNELAVAPAPLSVQALCKKVRVDEVSVYRTVDLLLAEGFLEEVPTKGNTPTYALSLGHHHHVVCTTCQKVAHIECNEEVSIPKKIVGFSKIATHELTFYGVCNNCV